MSPNEDAPTPSDDFLSFLKGTQDIEPWRKDPNIGPVVRWMFRTSPNLCQIYLDILSKNHEKLLDSECVLSPFHPIERLHLSMALGRVARSTQDPNIFFSLTPYKYGNGEPIREISGNLLLVEAAAAGHTDYFARVLPRFKPMESALAWSILFASDRNDGSEFFIRQTLDAMESRWGAEFIEETFEYLDALQDLRDSLAGEDFASELSEIMPEGADLISLYRLAVLSINCGRKDSLKTVLEKDKKNILDMFLPDLLKLAIEKKNIDLLGILAKQLQAGKSFLTSHSVWRDPFVFKDQEGVLIEIIYSAIDKRDVDFLKRALSSDLTECFYDHNPYEKALFYAAECNDEEMVGAVLSVLPEDSRSKTAHIMKKCIAEGRLLSLKAMMEHHIALNTQFEITEVLAAAIETRNFDTLRTITTYCRSCDMNLGSCLIGMSNAARSGFVAGYEFLLGLAHEMISRKPAEEQVLTPLDYSRVQNGIVVSIAEKHYGIVDTYLSNRFSNDDPVMKTALIVAAESGSQEFFQKIYDKVGDNIRADVFEKTTKSFSLKSFAAAGRFFCCGYNNEDKLREFYKQRMHNFHPSISPDAGVFDGLKHIHDKTPLFGAFFELICSRLDAENPDKVVERLLNEGFPSEIPALCQAIREDRSEELLDLIANLGKEAPVYEIAYSLLYSGNLPALESVLRQEGQRLSATERCRLIDSAFLSNLPDIIPLLDDGVTTLENSYGACNLDRIDDRTLVAMSSLLQRSNLRALFLSKALPEQHPLFIQKMKEPPSPDASINLAL